MTKTTRTRRLTAALVGALLCAGAITIPAYGVAQKAPASGFSAYVNGTVVHAHAAQLPPKLVDADVAFASNAFNGGGLKKDIVSEVNELIAPAAAGKNVHARGGGVEVGVGQAVPTDAEGRPIELPLAIAQAATDKAPFADGPNVTSIVDLEGALDPLVNAQVLQGIAAALWNPNYLFPMLGNPIGYAYGTAADVEALNVGEIENGDFQAPLLDTEAPGPERNVSSSQTFTYLVNNGDGTCGIATETHMTIAPIQISLPPDATAPQTGLLIEVAGDWVMKAQATGKPTGNKVTYSPDPNQDPASFVLRVLDLSQPAGSQVLGELKLQDILGPTGLAEQLDDLDPILDVAVGADPRAISAAGAIPDDESSPTITPTHVSAAADVIRLKVGAGLAEGFEVADLRVGHFETDIRVPAGGVNCEIPIAKTSSVPVAGAGQQFSFQVRIPATTASVIPFPCDLTNVRVTDVLTVEKADNPAKPPKMDLVSGVGPKGEVGKVSADKQSIEFANLGSWKPGAKPIIVTIKAIVTPDSGNGIMKDTATAFATAANCKASNSVLGSVIDRIVGAVTGGTGGTGGTDVTGGFFGSDGTGLTGNVRGGGPVKLTGKGLLEGPRVGTVKVLPSTGVGSQMPLALGVLALAMVAAIFRRTGMAR